MALQEDSRPIVQTNVETPLGVFQLFATASGLRRVQFPANVVRDAVNIPPTLFTEREESDIPRSVADQIPIVNTHDAAHTLQHAQTWLLAYFRRAPLPSLPPLDLSWCTRFGQSVYRQLIAVPPGAVTTYGELAREISCAGAARAVGSWMKKNQLPLFIPCHRVLPQNGSAGGWSGPEGLKEWLLAHERNMF